MNRILKVVRKPQYPPYAKLRWRLWNPSTQADFDAQTTVKNVYLSDPAVVFAYISLSPSQRATRFCSDFADDGRIRRKRVPKGLAFVVQDLDGSLFYVVVEGTYVFDQLR